MKRISFKLKSHQNYHSELYQPTYICLLVFRPNARRWYTLHSTIRCANSMSSRSKCVWFHLEITRTVHTSVNRGQSTYVDWYIDSRHFYREQSCTATKPHKSFDNLVWFQNNLHITACRPAELEQASPEFIEKWQKVNEYFPSCDAFWQFKTCNLRFVYTYNYLLRWNGKVLFRIRHVAMDDNNNSDLPSFSSSFSFFFLITLSLSTNGQEFRKIVCGKMFLKEIREVLFSMLQSSNMIWMMVPNWDRRITWNVRREQHHACIQFKVEIISAMKLAKN